MKSKLVVRKIIKKFIISIEEIQNKQDERDDKNLIAE
ncbi:hypothetical protein AMET1_0979 [Methanonatronarchaeum thermophilum]|uniref:Uncharacterized protein n=1 Tax=Methanonatronarchaeum thermophilum TaxID=1927129 RepID=A0A1Y3GG87_9EURY|nr:hypothetical protein AMET1_0979 [Methanonatronarchaeum thermophilum]